MLTCNIYLREPMWATLTGFLLAGDVLSLPAWIGCGCILLGMIVGVMRFPLTRKRIGRSGGHQQMNGIRM